MAKNYVSDLSVKLDTLKQYAFSDKSIRELEKETSGDLFGKDGEKYRAAFLSVCNTRERAHVFHASALSLEEAVEKVCEAAVKGVTDLKLDARWIKLDVVIKSEEVDPQKAVDKMFSWHHCFFRRGISFDPKYEYAYIEGEINGAGLLNYKEKVFDLRTFNDYTMRRDDNVILKNPKTLILFDCASWFIDERGRTYTLYTKGLEIGRRICNEVTPAVVKGVIESGVKYLKAQLKPDGRFDYGFYPINDKLIPGYNIMRHASTLWSLIWSADIRRDPDTYRATCSAIKYMLSQIRVYDDGCAYLIEESKKEIKIGGNGVAIITLSQFMRVYDTREYVKICEQLGHGILRMMKPDGGFVHVLNSTDRSLKDEYRTVYYDGEVTFALCRLHSLTGSLLWLEAARRSVDHFIRANYAQYKDHWVAYAVNELTMYDKSEKYYEFALKNITDNLDVIFKQATTYHTYLEMLMAGYDTYKRMVEEGVQIEALKEFDAHRLAETIFKRAHRMLNGYGYPEFVMYLSRPSFYRGAFFTRQDLFRIRIDDVQHFCGAYIAFYKNYDEIRKLLEK